MRTSLAPAGLEASLVLSVTLSQNGVLSFNLSGDQVFLTVDFPSVGDCPLSFPAETDTYFQPSPKLMFSRAKGRSLREQTWVILLNYYRFLEELNLLQALNSFQSLELSLCC